jgi:hypothetical protein
LATTTNLSTLKINKLTQAQYDRELAAGNIDANALYLTPDEALDLSIYATAEQLATKADASHNHDDRYYTESEIDAKLASISDGISGGNYMSINNPTGTGSFSMNRKAGTTIGQYSVAEGNGAEASGYGSHAEGESVASGDLAHAEGVSTAEGLHAHSEGFQAVAWGEKSHAEGYGARAEGCASHAEGWFTSTQGTAAHAEGNQTQANGEYSHAAGYFTNAHSDNQYVIGHYNQASQSGSTTGTTGDAFIIGKGTDSSFSNAMRVTFAGKIFAAQTTITAGADYAEFFEWQDANPNSEDRRGYFVTLDGENIKIATPDDYILGIVSGMPCVIGNGDEDWRGRYILDEFGAFITEEFEYETEIINKETGEITTVTKTGTRYKENPDYDPTLPYIQRENRPEWDAVGMMGVLSVRDDGTCQVNGFCKVAEGGIATASESGYRVIKRINENIVKVVFK